MHDLKLLLVGPFDPSHGLYSFVAPPLGAWRLAGFLKSRGISCQVFDPNLSSSPYEDIERLVKDFNFPLIGFSFTGMTLPYDLSLAHLTKKLSARSILFAGGVEATFNYRLIMSNAPLDMIILGEGEFPTLRICEAIEKGKPLEGIQGIVTRTKHGLSVVPNQPLSFEEFREATLALPLDKIPFEAYWNKLKKLWGIAEVGMDESKLKQTHCINLVASNYCPLKCSFCSYTNFLDFACDRKGVKTYQLTADDAVHMVKKALTLHPDTRTIVFRDDLFVFKNDRRIKPFCEGIISAKEKGELDKRLTFICSSRVDTVSKELLGMMKRAGFRLIGYGIESFSKNMLREFNKTNTFKYVEQTISDTINAGITPFLNIILSSPDSTMKDIVTTLSKVFYYQKKGCEMSIYPYVMPFSGSHMAEQPGLEPYKVYHDMQIPHTDIAFMQPVKIMPKDNSVRNFMKELETQIMADTKDLAETLRLTHLPSRIRSIITVYSAAKILKDRGIALPFSPQEVMDLSRLSESGLS